MSLSHQRELITLEEQSIKMKRTFKLRSRRCKYESLLPTSSEKHKLLKLSEPQFLHLKKKTNISIGFHRNERLPRGLAELLYVNIVKEYGKVRDIFSTVFVPVLSQDLLLTNQRESCPLSKHIVKASEGSCLCRW